MAQLISNLTTGSKIKLGTYQVESETAQPIVWQIIDKNHTGYPTNSVTLLTEKIIDLRGFDAKEPANSDSNRRIYGNNRYKDSNLRQWLNKAGQPWFEKTHTADEPPTDGGMSKPTGYNTKEGFLSSFSVGELSAILDTTLTVAKNTVTDGGGSETVTDKVFLLSNTEVGLANENNIVEGSLFSVFSSSTARKAYLTQHAFDNAKSGSKPATINDAWYWWLRTPDAGYAYYVRNVDSSGVLSSNYASYGSYGVRPALNLKSDIFVSDTVDEDGCYTFLGFRVTLDKPITVPTGAIMEQIMFSPKVNNTDMQVKITDSEKIIYTADIDADTVDLEIVGKDGIIDKIAYTVD